MRWWVKYVLGSVAAGVTLFLVGVAFHLLIPIAAPFIPTQFSEHPALYREWTGWTRTYMVVHPFVYGFVFAAGFCGLRIWCAFPPRVCGGLSYGVGVFLAGCLPVYLLAFASFQVSPEVIISWMIQSVTQYAVAGMAVGWVCDGAQVQVSTILRAPASRV